MNDVINWYQTIPDLGIKGRMNTPEEFDRIGLPKDLSGKEVLDIGCNIGAFMLECHKRGSMGVSGVEHDNVWRYIANGIFTELGIEGDCTVFGDIEDYKDFVFDLVLLLSVTHLNEGMTGQELLDKAWCATDGLLILEINDRLQTEPLVLPDEAVFFGKNKDDRSVYHIWRK